MDEKIIIISGPTASGKSALALKMADEMDIVIINADSLQLYEGLPILSSQPTHEEQKKVKHFLYSYLKPNESSSVATWLSLVKSVVEGAWREKKLPIIVGGSGMYISKLVEGISEIPSIDEAVKNEAREFYEKFGHEELQRKLLEIGENKIADKQRLIRAYEVFLQTGKIISFWQKQPNKIIFPETKFIHINLNPDRKKLYDTCNRRFEKMLQSGALEEVRTLIEQGISDDKQITKTLGFYEIRAFLKGELNREKMLEIATQKTRNYAKRQLTWFRNQLPQKHVFTDSKAALNFLLSLKDEIQR